MPRNDLDPDLQRHRWAVGARIRAVRQERDLSQVRLAEIMGVDHRTISRAENGVHAVSIDLIARFARALGVPSARFFPDQLP